MKTKLTEAEQAKRGARLAKELRLKCGRDGYYWTTSGQRSDQGIFRMAKRILEGGV